MKRAAFLREPTGHPPPAELSTAREAAPSAMPPAPACLPSRAGARLCDEDLVAALLASSARRSDHLRALARRILDHVGGMPGLASATPERLRQIKGVDRARAARILAAVELSKRAQETVLDVGPSIRTPADVARAILARHAQAGKETFGVLFLDAKNRPRGYRIVSVGTLDQSLVHPREVFREAIAENAAKVIFFHNHPSGDPTPSDDDVRVTKRLAQAGDTLGIPVLDHIIVGSGGYASLKERGAL